MTIADTERSLLIIPIPERDGYPLLPSNIDMTAAKADAESRPDGNLIYRLLKVFVKKGKWANLSKKDFEEEFTPLQMLEVNETEWVTIMPGGTISATHALASEAFYYWPKY